jgi:hypothetical protein
MNLSVALRCAVGTISTEDLKAKLDRKDPVKIVETLAPERY